jgi:hypothetical protein
VEDSVQRRWSGAVRGAIRDIAAKQDWWIGEGWRLWSAAEPACPEGVVSMLTGAAAILGECWNFRRVADYGW